MREDLMFALRRLRHSPAFVLVAVLTLAVVVGANTAILSVADAVLFRPLPFADPDRVFLLQILNQTTGTKSTRFDNAFIDAINTHHRGVGPVATFTRGPRVIVETPDGAEAVPTLAVNEHYFPVLGVTARRGRVLGAGDEPGRTAILTDQSWRERFGSDPTIVGGTVTLGATVFDIVGVLPASFTAATTTFFAGRPEIITLMPPVTPGTAGGTFHPLLRLEPGVTREQAQAEMDSVVASARTNVPALAQQMPFLEDIRETIYPVGRDVMRFLFAAAVLVLLIGCANLANMLLARGRRYERETAVRSALGASRFRIVRPLLFEALLLGAAGSLLALAVTSLTFDALLRQVPAGAYGGARVGVDLRIALMALALGLGGGLLFAVVPAMRAARLDVLALLQGRHRRSRGQWRIGRPMIAVQVGLAVVLVFGAVVATRAFVDVLRIPLGFDPDRVAVVQVVPPPDSTDVGGFYRRLVEGLAARSDVVAAGATGTMPLGGATGWSTITRPDSKEAIAALAHTWPGFFETIGIAPVAGRLLQWTDAGTGGAVITEAAARALFGDAPPLGQMIDAGTQGQLLVVGVVAAPRHQMTAPASGGPPRLDMDRVVHTIPTGRTSIATIVVKSRTTDEAFLRALKRDVGRESPGAPVSVTWWSESIGGMGAIRDPRFRALVLGAFAVIAIGLTVVGVYGIVAFLVANRTREMGIRLAIGAEPGRLVLLMVRQALVPVCVGLVAGLASAIPLARLAESRFVQLDTSESWPLVLAGAVLLAATAIAAFAPARRAARVDPTVVLRTE